MNRRLGLPQQSPTREQGFGVLSTRSQTLSEYHIKGKGVQGELEVSSCEISTRPKSADTSHGSFKQKHLWDASRDSSIGRASYDSRQGSQDSRPPSKTSPEVRTPVCPEYEINPLRNSVDPSKRMDHQKGIRNQRHEPDNLSSRNVRSPLLGLRHAMYSPAPRERENSDDSMDSPRSSASSDRGSSSKAGGFPSIKVEKCAALPPMRQKSATSDSGRRTPSSPEGTNNLIVPSPVQQRRAKDGRVVVLTGNLENLRNLSKSESDIEDALKNCTFNSHGEGKPSRLDAHFRPNMVTRPRVHLTSASGSDVSQRASVSSARSPSPSRQIRLVPLRDSSRARSDNDLSAK